ncbi:MAG: type II toxin-antitoxin system RelE/ParE family toxin [Cytophagales bacterium]|nr:type II toxin-antitoxin system RelE/ParE family toxin [Cytophagales bacterium]
MVRNNLVKINWAPSAENSLQKAYEYISERSRANAEKVKTAISDMIDKLPENPERHSLDKYKKNNPGNYRSFEKYNYRVTYKYTEKEIRIIRIRHTKQEPLEY